VSDSTDRGLDEWAQRFLSGLRKSTEIAEELLHNNTRQSSRIRELERQLAEATARLKALETRLEKPLETVHDQPLAELLLEQNCLTHVFVASDRLMRVRSARETIETIAEVLGNFAGVVRYALWLRWERDPVLVRSEPTAPDTWRDVYSHSVRRDFEQGTFAQSEATPALPLSLPIRLDARLVGVLHVAEVGPQVDKVGRLQWDLFNLLSERCAASLCIGALRSQGHDDNPWNLVRENLGAKMESHT